MSCLSRSRASGLDQLMTHCKMYSEQVSASVSSSWVTKNNRRWSLLCGDHEKSLIPHYFPPAGVALFLCILYNDTLRDRGTICKKNKLHFKPGKSSITSSWALETCQCLLRDLSVMYPCGKCPEILDSVLLLESVNL